VLSSGASVTGSSTITDIDTAAIQRRTLTVLFASQVAGAVGMSIGMSVGALLAADMVSVGVSGLAQSAAVTGAALFAIPATRLVHQQGRGASLSAAYITAAFGGAMVVLSAMTNSIPLLFVGLFLFGGATTAGLQARYAAVDLAPPARYGRHLSLIVWASTLGGVVGPNLAALTGRLFAPWSVPTLAAPFVLSALLFLATSVFLFTMLRPDPRRIARQLAAAGAVPEATRHAAAAKSPGGMRSAFNIVRANAAARLGVLSTVVGHVIMVGVMSMTPVHIRGAGHGAARTLQIVGIVLSLHVAGMYAFAPLTGWLSDRYGRRAVIFGGVALLIAACAVAGTAGHDSARLAIGLVLLGLGWSATMVAGSALLSESVPAAVRPSVQGFSDLIMGLAGASAGALSGVVVYAFGYATLAAVAAIVTAPLLFSAIRVRAPSSVPT
jgi:MFS family permease